MEHYVYWVHLEGQDMLKDGYVGVTNNIERRWKEHIRSNSCIHFSNAISKYKNDLIWEIVFIGTETECYEKELLYRPTAEIGWNIAKGGNMSLRKSGNVPWNKGKTGVYSESTLKAIGAATKERVQGENNPMFNKTHTDEAKAKISAAHKGKEGMKGEENPQAKKVRCIDTNQIFSTITEAAKSVNVSIQALSTHLNGKSKSCAKLQWEYFHD